MPVVNASPDKYYLYTTATSGITPTGRYMNTPDGGSSTTLSCTAGTTYYWYYSNTGTYANPYMIDAGSYSFYYVLNAAVSGLTADLEVYRCDSDGSNAVLIVSTTGASLSGTSGTATIGSAGWQDVSGKRLRFSFKPSLACVLKIRDQANSALNIPATEVPEGTLLFLLIAPAIPLISRRRLHNKRKV